MALQPAVTFVLGFPGLAPGFVTDPRAVEVAVAQDIEAFLGVDKLSKVTEMPQNAGPSWALNITVSLVPGGSNAVRPITQPNQVPDILRRCLHHVGNVRHVCSIGCLMQLIEQHTTAYALALSSACLRVLVQQDQFELQSMHQMVPGHKCR